MSYSKIAQALGRRGGLARARRLSLTRKKQIAAQGGKSRALSIQASKRIESNFAYVEAINALSPPSKVRSVKLTHQPLPKIHG